MGETGSSHQPSHGGLDALRRHPVISGLMLGLTLGGVLLGVVYLDAEWSLLRRAAAGGLVGFGTALLVTATKLLG
jgi:hypothetical protein